MRDEKKAALSGMLWVSLEQYGVLGIQFVFQIILARLLEPSAYGVIAIVTIFIAVANVFIQTGFSTALVQKKDIDEIDLSSVFYFSLFIAIILYALIYISSPSVANYFSMVELVELLRVMSLEILFGAFVSIETAILRRNLQFKKIFVTSIVSIVFSGIIGIVLAYMGFGVLSLAVQSLSQQIISTIVLIVIGKSFPKFIFSLQRLRVILQFGWKILLTNVIDEIASEMRTIVIGKKYDSNSLSYFNKGKQFPNLLVKSVNGALSAVLLPVFSMHQDNVENIRSMSSRAIKTSAFFIFPLLAGLVACSKSLVLLLLTEKWLPCVVYIQIYCIYYATWPITTTNLQALNAMGRSDITMRVEIIRKIIDLIVLLVSMNYGTITIAIGAAFVSIISLFIYLIPCKKIMGQSVYAQLKSIAPEFLASLVMGVVVYLVQMIKLHPFATLFAQIVIGIIVYCGMALLFRMDSFIYVVETAKEVTHMRIAKLKKRRS